MLVLDPSGGLVDRTVRDLPQYLEAGDVMVLNDSRVLPARLIGRRRDGGEAEVLLLQRVTAAGGFTTLQLDRPLGAVAHLEL